MLVAPNAAGKTGQSRSAGAAGKPAESWLPIATLVVILGLANLWLFYLPMGMRM